MTEQEIIENEAFIIELASEYRKLGRELIEKLALKFGIEIYKEFPASSFFKFKSNGTQSGILNDEWKYFLHGQECRFYNQIDGNTIDVILRFNDEYGVLDPFFFAIFIKTHQNYINFGLKLYNDFEDGCKILEVMEKRGKFVRIFNEGKREFQLTDDLTIEMSISFNGLIVKE